MSVHFPHFEPVTVIHRHYEVVLSDGTYIQLTADSKSGAADTAVIIHPRLHVTSVQFLHAEIFTA